ncbi:MAG TPA: phosphoribosylglycinamide formyltransferase [Egibacteraceae bacterium]|nr:phosphoribosylglycinamide formyltransferase [Egibacteraceae bacterium]
MGKQLVVLISGTGSNLQALLDHGALGGEVNRVVSDRPDAAGLERARARGVDAVCVAPGAHDDRRGWDAALCDAVAAAAPDLVVLAGFMRILSPAFVNRWPVLNVHPSLLPAFPGARAVADALDWGVKLTGATVHFVDEEVDHGPIVAQEAVPVRPDDTPASLHRRIQAVEHRLLPECVALFCHDRLAVRGRQVSVRA